MSGLSANAKVNLLANCFGALHSNSYCFPWPRPKFGGSLVLPRISQDICTSQKVRLIIIIFLMFFFFVKDVNE